MKYKQIAVNETRPKKDFEYNKFELITLIILK